MTNTMESKASGAGDASNVSDTSVGVSSERSALSAGAEPSLSPGQAQTSADGSSQPEVKKPFPPPADTPTQVGPDGVRFDFNLGCRVSLPKSEEEWRVRLSDLDTGSILYETKNKGSLVRSSKRFYVPFKIEVWRSDQEVLVHEYSASNRQVLIQFPIGTLGDTIGWLPYAARFAERHGCHLTCAMAERLIPLFRDAYPGIKFVNHEEVEPARFYATYNLGLFFDDADCKQQPCDFRVVGLHRTAAYILGVDPAEAPPRIALADDTRPIAEPYVCIAAQSTTQAKYWNNPNGWREIVAFLKESGYRVICIDQKPTTGSGIVWNHIPYGSEDETGDRPLLERARWLKHAEFFVGLASGLSWLAWSVGTPVVMISGFSHPTTEFSTPYRVINYHVCNSCWNDAHHRFDHRDFLWCPRHKDTPRQFECTRLITPHHVKAVIASIPAFAARSAAAG